jgi:hypothetical protein
MQHLQSTIRRALEALDKLPPEFHRKLENPVELTGRKIQELVEFLRESGLDKIAGTEFLADALDVAHALVSKKTSERDWAAKRLAEITIFSFSKRPRSCLKRLREKAQAAGMSPTDYLQQILITGGVLDATRVMDLPQTWRPGKKWVKDKLGKKKLQRPDRDLKVAEFIRWVYLKGHGFALDALLEMPANQDALNTNRKKASDKKKGDRAKDESENRTVLTADHAKDEIDRAAVTDFTAVAIAKAACDEALRKASSKEKQRLEAALEDGGDLNTWLQEQGYPVPTIRKIRERLRKLSK